MQVNNFPNYRTGVPLDGHTLFKPSDLMGDSLKKLVDPTALNLGLDDALRTIMPSLPYDPSFVRNHGMLGVIGNTDLDHAGTYHVDLGNLERGRPVLTNTASWTKDDWNSSPEKYEFMKKIMEKQSANAYDKDLIDLLTQVFKRKTTGFRKGMTRIGAVAGAGAGAGGTAVKQLWDDQIHKDDIEYQIANSGKNRLREVLKNSLIGAGAGGTLGFGAGAHMRNSVARKGVNKLIGELDHHYYSFFNTPKLQEMFPKNQFLEKALLEANRNKDNFSFTDALFKKSAEQKKPEKLKTDQKNKKKDRNESISRLNPYLLAGIPLALGGSLSLKASLPASRMGLRQIRQSLTGKPYKPHEMVDDYLSASAGMKNSPLRPTMSYLDSVSKGTPEEMIDEAIHWREMTAGKNQGLDRWIHEVRRKMSNPAKQKNFDRRVEHLKKVIGNNPDNLAATENDPIATGVLARLAAHNAEPAKKFSTLGLANTLGFGAGVGLASKGVADELRKEGNEYFADETNKGGITQSEAAKLLAGAGLSGLSVHDFIKARKLTGSNVIGVTAGKLDEPMVSSATGAGHKTPAEAIIEGLEKHPAVQSGEFALDHAIRENEGKNIKWLRGAKPADNWLATVESGFGNNLTGLAGAGRSAVWSNPFGQILFVPDPPPKDQPFFWLHPHKNHGVISRALGADQPIVTFGPDDLSHHQGKRRLANFPLAHPALKDSVLQNAESALKDGKPDRVQVLSNMLEVARTDGDTHTLEVLKNAIKNKHKILTISGASRGDQVMTRAREVYEELARRGLNDKYTILALAGAAKKDHRALQLMDKATGKNLPIASFGSMKQPEYIAAQNVGDHHWGSTGANSLAEARAQATPAAFTTNNNEWKQRELQALRAMGAPADLINSVEKIDLDSWNEGTIHELMNKYKAENGMTDALLDEGIKPVRSAREFVDAAEQEIDPAILRSRAAGYVRDARQSKKKLIDKIIEHARQAKTQSHRAANWHNILGGMLLGGGVSAGTQGLVDMIRRKIKNKDAYE